jgi:hypothetical protein
MIVFLAMGLVWLFVPPPYHWVAPFIAIAFAVKASRDSVATRCPRCHGRLGRLASEAAAVRSAKGAAAHRRKLEELGGCPNCGLRLDEESESKSSGYRGDGPHAAHQRPVGVPNR